MCYSGLLSEAMEEEAQYQQPHLGLLSPLVLFESLAIYSSPYALESILI